MATFERHCAEAQQTSGKAFANLDAFQARWQHLPTVNATKNYCRVSVAPVQDRGLMGSHVQSARNSHSSFTKPKPASSHGGVKVDYPKLGQALASIPGRAAKVED